ncbi:MAG TPA: YfhO family protein, partial [Burkholderiales bacterium]|nr:YfhO family protein [Burkholderiales bacterium]
LFALGRYTPVFSLAFDWLPAVSMFRRPVDANFVLLAALALLVGFLLTDYIRDGLPPRRILRSIVLTLCVLAFLVWAIALSQRSGRADAAIIEALKVAPIPVLVIAVLAIARTEQSRIWAAGVVVAVAVAELLWWNAATRLNAEDRPYYMVLERPTGENARALDVLVQAVREAQRNGERPRIEVVGVGGPWQNLAVTLGLEATNGYNPLRIGLYDRLISPGETTYDVAQRKFPASFDGYDCALARVLGLGFIVLDRPIERVASMAKRPVADLLHDGPEVWIYRLRDPTPRLKFISRVQIADAEAVTGSGRLLVEPSPDRVLIDDETPPTRPYWAAATETDAGRARIVLWRPDRIEIDVQSDLGGILVLHDVYYPGWIAEIDGKEVPILRADVLFRGVEIRPGQHRVVFRFAPFSFANLARALDGVLRNGDRNKGLRRPDRGNRQRRQ